jgi:DNA-directed RNA polymerase subunit RPC12/RpoP
VGDATPGHETFSTAGLRSLDMPSVPDSFHCGTCDREIDREDATRTRTFADLDPSKWQSVCCPDCGRRLKTVFVGLEDRE